MYLENIAAKVGLSIQINEFILKLNEYKRSKSLFVRSWPKVTWIWPLRVVECCDGPA